MMMAKWLKIPAGPRTCFDRDERGAVSIEYGLLVAALSVGIIWSFSSISGAIEDTLSTASLSLSERAGGNSGGGSSSGQGGGG